MAISNERRHYLTLPDAEYKRRLQAEAREKGMSVSSYVVYRLNLLRAIEQTPNGQQAIEKMEEALVIVNAL